MSGNRKVNSSVRFPAKKEKSLILIFAAAFCFIVILISFFPMTLSIEDDVYIKKLEKRITELEGRLAGVDLTPEKLRRINVQGAKVESFINNYDRLDASIRLKTNLLADRLDKVQLQIDNIKRQKSQKKNFKKTVKKKAVKRNKRKKTFHTVKQGETFYSISRKYGISLVRLKQLNGFNEKTIIYPGQDILVK